MTAKKSTPAPVIVWFRDDLRLSDQPALAAAAETGQPLICVYIHDPDAAGERAPGAALRWWLHVSLAALDASLRERGGRLVILQGAEAATLEDFVESSGATGVFW
ncbi:MAG: deoxyribodipyrimidine photo-lyase, partial [Paraburkholderia tropica]